MSPPVRTLSSNSGAYGCRFHPHRHSPFIAIGIPGDAPITRLSLRGLRWPGDNETPPLGPNIGAEGPARVTEPACDPRCIRTLGETGEAEVQLQREGFEPDGLGAPDRDHEQEPEIVAEMRIDRVVVEEVAEVVHDPALDAVKDMGRMAGDERRSGIDEYVCRRADVGARLGGHVGSPVRCNQHDIGIYGTDRLGEPVWYAVSQIGEGHAGSVGARCVLGWVVRDPENRDPDAVSLEGRVPARLCEVTPGSDVSDPDLVEEPDCVEKPLHAEVERMIVRQRHARYAEVLKNTDRAWRCTEEKALPRVAPC